LVSFLYKCRENPEWFTERSHIDLAEDPKHWQQVSVAWGREESYTTNV
jgi:hypothetical protein